MKNLVEKVRKMIPLLVEDYTLEKTGSFDFLHHKKEIMKELDFCRKTGTLVGVYSKKLGNGLFLVGVEEIVYGIKAELIIFRPFDMSGYHLTDRTVLLEEIDMIIPFNNRYVKPDISIPSEVVEVTRYVNKRSKINSVVSKVD
jgi:hypothetical protein